MAQNVRVYNMKYVLLSDTLQILGYQSSQLTILPSLWKFVLRLKITTLPGMIK